jgi:two-component system, NarL family, response regulator LiaR
MQLQDSIRVLICDDHVIVRHGLDALISSLDNITLVGTASNAAEAIQMCRRLSPSVVLMDLRMPDMDGVTAIQQIVAQNPQIKVIALTSYDAGDLVEAALNAGATGYLMKNVSGQELANAIVAATKGIPTLSPEAARHLMRATLRTRMNDDMLTRREHEVLKLMVQGLKNADIAEMLSVSPFTVKNHVSNILGKLNVATRTEAVSFAINHRLVDMDVRSQITD